MRADHRISVTWLLMIGIVLGGFVLRSLRPSMPPLDEREAVSAIQAAMEAGQAPALAGMLSLGGPSDASYHALTGVIIQWAGATDLAARWVPILAGTALLLIPLLARRALRRWEMLVFAGLMALSPALVTVSRTAGGRSMALLGIAFAGICLLEGWSSGSPSRISSWWPIGVGLAACSGPSGWTGILVLLLAALAVVSLRRRATGTWELPPTEGRAWASALVTVLVVSTGAGLMPGGLRAVATGLGEWIQGWIHGGTLGVLLFPLALAAYEPLCLLVGGIHAGRVIRRADAGERWLLAWAVAGLVVPILYPARDAGDLVWSLLPLALLASKEAGVLIAPDEDSVTALSRVAMVIVLLVLGAFAYLQVSAYLAGLAPGFDPLGNPGLSLIFGMLALGLGIVMLILFALGWSREAAFQAGSQAIWMLLMLAMVAGVWRLNFRETALHGGDLWRSDATSPQQAQLRGTLAGVSQTSRTGSDPVTLMAEGDLPASLVWTLRDLPIVPSIGYQLEDSPSILLTPEAGNLPLPSDYVGQTFTLREHTAWGMLSPSEAVTWWLRGTGPAQQERWIVLVRSDLASPDVILPEDP